MDLKSAIKIAIRFTEKGKGLSTIRQFVRFFPKTPTLPARLCAQSARCGVLVNVYEDIPNTLVSAAFLQKMVKDSTEFSITATLSAYGGVEFKSGSSAWHWQAEMVPQLELFPEVPILPEEFSGIDGRAIERVLHAASKDPDRVNLQSLHFVDGCVEATDKARFARASLSWQEQGLLPSEMFQRLSKGSLTAAFTLRLAYIRSSAEDEIRFASYVALPFPDCKELIPAEHEGGRVIVSVKSLLHAAKQALSVSDTGSVTLRFGELKLVVSSWHKDKEPQLFEANVCLFPSNRSPDSQVLVSGKNLVAALKSLSTPTVLLCYNRPSDPLRLESAGYVEALWPMLA